MTQKNMNLKKRPTRALYGRVKPHPLQKLNEEQQIFVVERLAEFIPSKRIKRMLKDKWGVVVHSTAIDKYKDTQRWQPLLQQKRDEYLVNIGHVPVATPRWRLDIIQSVVNSVLEGRMPKDKAETIIKCLSFAQSETQKKGSDSYNLVLAQYNTRMTDEEIEQKQKQLLRRLKQIDDKAKGRIEDVTI